MNLRDPKTPIQITEPYLKFVENYLNEQDQKVFEFAKAQAVALAKDFMSVSAFEGQLISSFAGVVQPSIIVEIGTLTGYSALWLAKALNPGGVIYTLEKDLVYGQVAKQVFEKASGLFEDKNSCFFQKSIQLKIGDAQTLLLGINTQPQVVFIDANKSSYFEYTQWAVRSLARQGVIILDNAFLRGEVFSGHSQHFSANQIKSVKSSIEMLMSDKSFHCFLVPTTEGLLIAHKKSL
jgi:predicted O-methyltransferase YrrM